jgi:hypothetical protein
MTQDENGPKVIRIDNIDEISFDNLQEGMLIVRVGNEKHPASDEDIENVRIAFLEIKERHPGVKLTVFVTNHLIDITAIDFSGLKTEE